MNALEMFQTIDWQHYSGKLAITLLHLLWQGMVAGAIVAAGLRLLKNSSANYRYLFAIVVLFALPVVGVITFTSSSMPHSVAGIDTASEYPNASDALIETGGFEFNNGNRVVESEDGSEFAAPAQSITTSTDFSSASSSPIVPAEKTGGDWLQPILQPISFWLSMFYVLGVAVMGLRLLLSMLRGIRLRNTSRLVGDRATLSLISKVADRIGLAAAPAAYFCERVAVPVVVGIWKPVLLMPVSILTNLTHQQLTAIISHELAHIRRLDPLMQLLQRTVEAVLFFHPVVWWISRQISNEREDCCDDMAAAAGVGRVEYALSLLRIAELSLPNQSQRYTEQFAALSARGTSRNQLVRRIERQIRLGETPIARPRWTMFCSAILLLVVFSITAVAATNTSLVENPANQEQPASGPIDELIENTVRPEEHEIVWGDPEDGIRIGVRPSPLQGSESPTEFVHGDWLRYEVWIRNESEAAIEIQRDPGTMFAAKLEGDTINLAGSSNWLIFGIPRETMMKAQLSLAPGKSALLLLQQSVQFPFAAPGTKQRVPKLITPPGKYRVFAQCDVTYRTGENEGEKGDFKTARPTSGSIEISLEASKEETKGMEEDVTVAGKVIGEDGKAIANLPIAIDYVNERTASINARMIKTDADGQFAVEDLPSDARIFVRYSRGSNEDVVSPASQQTAVLQQRIGNIFAIVEVAAGDKEARDNVILDLSKSTCTITGKLEDKNGSGVSGAEVTANYQPSSNRLDHSVRATTNQDGIFTIEGLPANSFSVSAIVDHSKHGPARVVQLESGKTTNLDLKDFFQGQDPSEGGTEPSWGETFDDSLQAGIMIEGGQSEFKVGDIVQAKLFARNTMDTPLTFTHASATDRFHLELTPAQAEKKSQVETRDYSRFTGWVAEREYQLKPGQEIELATLELQVKRAADRPAPNVYVSMDVEPGMKVRLVASLGDGFTPVVPRVPKSMPGKDHPVPTTGAVEFQIKDD